MIQSFIQLFTFSISHPFINLLIHPYIHPSIHSIHSRHPQIYLIIFSHFFSVFFYSTLYSVRFQRRAFSIDVVKWHYEIINFIHLTEAENKGMVLTERESILNDFEVAKRLLKQMQDHFTILESKVSKLRGSQ